MALTTFGPALDLHTGGADLRFPHHAYEAAMAEAVTGVRPFARAWLHGHRGVRRREDGEVDGQPRARHGGARDPPGRGAAAAAARPAVGAAVGVSAGGPRRRRGPARAALRRGLPRRRRRRAGTAGTAAVTAALLDDLDVPRALAVAEEEGGEAARLALSVLNL